MDEKTDDSQIMDRIYYGGVAGKRIGGAAKDETTSQLLQRKINKICSAKYTKRRIPIAQWLPKYNSADLLGDCISGLTVGLTILPQGIAYGFLAGLSPNYGLYSCYIGCFLYAIFGSSKATSIGPTAITALLTLEYAKGNPEAATLLCFTTGAMTILFAFFNLGFLCSFISKPVLSGFISGAAINIANSQLKALFGLKIKSDGFVETLKNIFLHISESNWSDFALGITCIISLTLIKKIGALPRFKRNKGDDFKAKTIKIIVFLLTIGRNAIIVISSSIVAFSFHEDQSFTITGEIKPGLPTVKVPQFIADEASNGTMNFMTMVSEAGTGLIVLPLITLMETVAVGNAFSEGNMIDATQEIYAVGLCNMIGSFFQIMPTAAAFSRSSINDQSGVRTPACNFFTGFLVILTMAVLTPYLKFIPLSTLAAVIICAVVHLIEYEEIVPIWRVRKIDELILWASFLTCVFWSLEIGLLIGVLINIGVLLYSAASPKIEIISFLEELNIPPHVIIEPRLGLLFVNIDTIRAKTSKVALTVAYGIYPIIIDCYHFSVLDYSASCGLKAMCQDFQNRSQPLFFINASPGVKRGLRAINSNVQIIEKENLLSVLTALPEKDNVKEQNAINFSIA